MMLGLEVRILPMFSPKPCPGVLVFINERKPAIFGGVARTLAKLSCFAASWFGGLGGGGGGGGLGGSLPKLISYLLSLCQ
jgi:hypothetical protein